jgi:hypothetical protein
VAARISGHEFETDMADDGSVSELAFGVNYYMNGHGNKLQLDVTFISIDDGGFVWWDPYPGLFPQGGIIGAGGDVDNLLLRFQWQLAL